LEIKDKESEMGAKRKRENFEFASQIAEKILSESERERN
jgi:hypothetical protein